MVIIIIIIAQFFAQFFLSECPMGREQQTRIKGTYGRGPDQERSTSHIGSGLKNQGRPHHCRDKTCEEISCNPSRPWHEALVETGSRGGGVGEGARHQTHQVGFSNRKG